MKQIQWLLKIEEWENGREAQNQVNTNLEVHNQEFRVQNRENYPNMR